jgi:hypothetical protein
MQVETLLLKATMGLAVAGVGGILMYPIRAIKKEWAGLREKLDATQAELVQQRENHLTHIQENGEAQVNLLEKVADTLSLMHLDQKETLGMLRNTKL